GVSKGGRHRLPGACRPAGGRGRRPGGLPQVPPASLPRLRVGFGVVACGRGSFGAQRHSWRAAARATGVGTRARPSPNVHREPGAAFRSVQARIQREEAARPPRWYERWLGRTTLGLRPLATPAIAVLLAAALATGFAVSGAAGSLIRVFEPHSIVAVQVSPSD